MDISPELIGRYTVYILILVAVVWVAVKGGKTK